MGKIVIVGLGIVILLLAAILAVCVWAVNQPCPEKECECNCECKQPMVTDLPIVSKTVAVSITTSTTSTTSTTTTTLRTVLLPDMHSEAISTTTTIVCSGRINSYGNCVHSDAVADVDLRHIGGTLG